MNTGKIIRAAVLGVLSAGAVTGIVIGNSKYQANAEAIKSVLVPTKYRVVDDGESSTPTKVKSGHALAEQVEEEGAVLLQNKKGTLPLSKAAANNNIAILGFGAAQWIYSGSGSGRVLSQTGDSAWNDMDDIEDAFRNDKVSLNESAQAVLDYYRSLGGISHDLNTLNNNMDQRGAQMYGLKDPSISANQHYADLLMDAADENETAVVILSRQGGESDDLPGTCQYVSSPSAKVDSERHGLEISEVEEELLTFAGENFKNVVVLINSTNAFQLDFLDRIPGIDACVFVGATGERGANAIPKLLFGESTFSGHLADTLPYDFQKTLYFQYSGYDGVDFYDNTDLPYGVNQQTNGGITSRPSLPYLDYVEGVYVGYRYFETADVEGVFSNASIGALDEDDKATTKTGYDAVVQFPFGYGLSYTTFEWTLAQIRDAKTQQDVHSGAKLTADTDLEILINVENTGSFSGKEVVQLYSVPQYNPGGVEKAHVNLIDFAKTPLLAPNDKTTVTLTAKARDLASFDCYDLNNNHHATYEIDKGEYRLRLQSDSHHMKPVRNPSGALIDGEILLHADDDIIMDHDEHTGVEIKTLFTGEDAIDGVAIDGSNDEFAVDDIDYVSRADFKSLKYDDMPLEAPHFGARATGRKMGENTKANVLFAGSNSGNQDKANAWNNSDVDCFGNEIDPDKLHNDTWGADPDPTLDLGIDANTATELGYELGDPANYDDPRWEDVLEKVTYNVAKSLVDRSHPDIPAVNALNVPFTHSIDGPNQISSFAAKESRGTGYPMATILAQTFNKNLAYEWGLSMGADMKSVDGIYGPAMNCHRSPFAGRNYEYYSEDPRLSGLIGGNSCKGLRDTGKVAWLKHFVAAETETSRDSLYTWMSEQALREIYLEPFRIAIEDYGVNALMTAYNRVGSKWCGGSEALMLGVLRGEWGFKGGVITDYSDNNQYMNADEAIRAGGDFGMNVALRFNYQTGRAAHALKEVVKHYLFMYCNTKLSQKLYLENPYGGYVPTLTEPIPGYNWVDPAIVSIDILVGALVVGMLYFAVTPFIFKGAPIA